MLQDLPPYDPRGPRHNLLWHTGREPYKPLCRTRQPFAVAAQTNKVYLPQEVLLVSTDLAWRQIIAIRYAPRRCSASSLTASAPRMNPITYRCTDSQVGLRPNHSAMRAADRVTIRLTVDPMNTCVVPKVRL